MIYEYGIDPELFIKLADQAIARIRILEAFRPGTPYVRAGYPANFKQIVMDMLKRQFEEASDKAKPSMQKRRKNIEELLGRLIYATTKRFNAKEWNSDFVGEAARLPFHAILTEDSRSAGEQITIEMLKDEYDNPFNHQMGLRVARQPESMNQALAPLLRNATDITFVDPFFYPLNERFAEPYKLFLFTISRANKIRVKDSERIINIVCAYDKALSDGKIDNFTKLCHEIIPEWLSNGTVLHIYPIKEVSLKQEHHNRYILTNIGGVMLGHGTDRTTSRKSSSKDDMVIMGKEQFEELSSLYKPNSPNFIWPGPIIIKEK